MIHKRYINDFEEPAIDLEFWCPETDEEIERFNKAIEKLELMSYFLGGGSFDEQDN